MRGVELPSLTAKNLGRAGASNGSMATTKLPFLHLLTAIGRLPQTTPWLAQQ
jgi:hypothetical protein